ncbi:unnamed protein product, partial [Rangifer tarandus platyrhynchus]
MASTTPGDQSQGTRAGAAGGRDARWGGGRNRACALPPAAGPAEQVWAAELLSFLSCNPDTSERAVLSAFSKVSGILEQQGGGDKYILICLAVRETEDQMGQSSAQGNTDATLRSEEADAHGPAAVFVDHPAELTLPLLETTSKAPAAESQQPGSQKPQSEEGEGKQTRVRSQAREDGVWEEVTGSTGTRGDLADWGRAAASGRG